MITFVIIALAVTTIVGVFLSSIFFVLLKQNRLNLEKEKVFINEIKSQFETSEKRSQELIEKNAKLMLENATSNEQKEGVLKNNIELKNDTEKIKFENKNLNETLLSLKTNLSSISATNEALELKIKDLKESLFKIEVEKSNLQKEKDKINQENTVLKEQEQFKLNQHHKMAQEMSDFLGSLRAKEENELNEKKMAELKILEDLKKTWSIHQNDVEEKMKLACQKIGVEYAINYPYTGRPDNAVFISGKYIVFDAKSPQSSDLKSFPTYIAKEAIAIDKYLKHEEVSNEVFLVVPHNAISFIKETHIQRGDKHIYVITTESLGAILQQLKKIENYTIVESLGVEDREAISSILGKMAYGMKRKIQIDHCLSKEFISILTSAENLPEDILMDAKKVEKTYKLNLPPAKTKKEILISDLKKDSEKISGLIDGQGLEIQDEKELLGKIGSVRFFLSEHVRNNFVVLRRGDLDGKKYEYFKN